MARTPTPLKRALVSVAYGVLCVGSLALGVVAGWIGESEVGSAYLRQTVLNVDPKEVFKDQGSLTILLLGCDADVSYGGKTVLNSKARSDTMMVAKLDFNRQRISGVGIPRDLLVATEGYRAQKINAYHSLGGPALAAKATQEVLGIAIDRTVVLDYDSFQKMVDMVGGVEVFVPKRMKYTDKRANPPLLIDFKPGRQKMNGYDALCFVRFRHSDDTFHRQSRQIDFMLSFKQAVKQKPQVANRLVDELRHLLGDTFSPDEMAALARFAQDVPKESIAFGTVPVKPASNYNFRIDDEKLDQVLEEFNLRESSTLVSRR